MAPMRFGFALRPGVSRLAASTVVSLSLAACSLSREAPSAGEAARAAPAPTAALADARKPNASPLARKVIRSAELSLEVDSPAKTQTELAAIAEQVGGYVASSEREVSGDDGEHAASRVNMVLRVPSDKLGTTLNRLKRLGRGAESERLGSEDVTDEYIDIGARIANQKRLEAQLGTLLTQANTVDAALHVHKELASVRTEIDRMEGRRQFLEKEADLAKISLTLSALRPLVRVSASELGVSLRRAAADSVSVAAAVALGSVRLLGVFLPLVLLFGLPGWGTWRLLRRRQVRLRAVKHA